MASTIFYLINWIVQCASLLNNSTEYINNIIITNRIRITNIVLLIYYQEKKLKQKKMILKGNVVAVDVKEGNGKVAKVNNRVSVLDKLVKC